MLYFFICIIGCGSCISTHTYTHYTLDQCLELDSGMLLKCDLCHHYWLLQFPQYHAQDKLASGNCLFSHNNCVSRSLSISLSCFFSCFHSFGFILFFLLPFVDAYKAIYKEKKRFIDFSFENKSRLLKLKSNLCAPQTHKYIVIVIAFEDGRSKKKTNEIFRL